MESFYFDIFYFFLQTLFLIISFETLFERHP